MKQRGRLFEKSPECVVPTSLPTPTRCTPGSPEKVEVLRQRYASGVFLHHPEDVSFRKSKPYERLFGVVF